MRMLERVQKYRTTAFFLMKVNFFNFKVQNFYLKIKNISIK